MKKKYGIFHTLKYLWKGQTMARILMNKALSQQTLRGVIVDIGGGRNPDYFQYLRHDTENKIKAIDGSMDGIDFEKDRLPFENNSVDTVLLCNVLEHIYNHKFLLSEILRIMRPNGQIIGFVPFWVGYHADPHDYFRYTDECLIRIFNEVGFKDTKIERIGGGSFLGNFNNVVLSVPRFMRPILYFPYMTLNTIFLKVRPESVKRNPLGYLFTARN